MSVDVGIKQKGHQPVMFQCYPKEGWDFECEYKLTNKCSMAVTLVPGTSLQRSNDDGGYVWKMFPCPNHPNGKLRLWRIIWRQE